MTLRVVVDSLEDVPEAFHEEYEERDGKYHLKLEGTPPGTVKASEHQELKRKLADFRDSYTGVMKRAAEIAGVDEMPDDLSPLKQNLDNLKNKLSELEDSSTNDKHTLQEMVQKAVKPIQEKLDRAESERIAAQERANKAMLRESLGTVLQKQGARANAMSYLLEQAEKAFEVKDDEVVARDGLFSEDDPTKPLSPDEWVKKAVKDHDFAFEKSKGGDLPPAPPGGGPAPPRTGVKVLKNPTPEELGLNAEEIAAGKMQIVNE